MEDLIKQAFLQVDVLGPHVQQGHYDLIGPDGEIILPTVWEKVVQPDWAITMTMWPLDKIPGPPRMPGGMPPPGMGGRHHVGGHGGGIPMMGGHRIPVPPGMPPPGRRPGGLPGGIHPPPGWGMPMGGDRPNIIQVDPPHAKGGKAPAPKARNSVLYGFLAGKPHKKK